MKLVCHTRGNTTPQNKPKVYFTGYPADMESCREDIFSDILRTQNCAIYYDGEPDAFYEPEELEQTLRQMQLIVIPVTSRFLYQPGRARDVELPFAIEHHIPILPLLQEQETEADFNKKFGDLQILNKYDRNPVVIPYSRKLKKFLDSVLAGDELAARIRTAFAGYIFLSYRKKDRKYAHELMKLIHKNEFCQDVAIWYDEFLMPGEDFTKNIQDAIDKSSLVVMAITPNMVSEDNYVIRHEYPRARSTQKAILPVEMLPTDQEALCASFPDIPRSVPAQDAAALADGLRAGLSGVTARALSPEPVRDYLIGLAYLNGIDVEVDKNRAADLINGAAEAGLPEAMEKLVEMYGSGNGVPRSYRTAAKWQQRLADWRQAQFEQSETKENALMWSLALCGLGDCREKLGDLPAAVQTYKRMEEISRQFAGRCSMGALSCLRFGYERLGDICLREERPEEAEQYYLRELETAKRLDETEEYPFKEEYQTVARYIEPLGRIASCYIHLGQVSIAQGKWDKAGEYFLKSLEISRQMCEREESTGARKSLADAYAWLGRVRQEAFAFGEAQDYFQRGLEIYRQLYEEAEAPEVWIGLTNVYCQLGQISCIELKFAEGEALFRQGLEISRQIYESTGSIEARRRLSLLYNNLGAVTGRPNDAKRYFQEGLKLSRQLYEETGSVQASRAFSGNLLNLGCISQKEGRLREAKEYQMQGLALRRRVYAETGSIEAQAEIAHSCLHLGRLCIEAGWLEEAGGYFRERLEIYRQRCESAGSIIDRYFLAINYFGLGWVAEIGDRPEEAEKYYLQELELLRQMDEDIKKSDMQVEFINIYYGLSRVIKDKKQAADYCLQGLELAGQLYEKAEEPKIREELSQKLAQGNRCMASILSDEGDQRQAVEYYEKALKISEEICDHLDLGKGYDDMALSCFQIGILADWDAALQRDMLTRAHDIWSRISEKYPEIPRYAQQRDKAQAELDKLSGQG